MYYVKKWDGDEAVSEHKHLASAKVAARGLGYARAHRQRIFLDPLPLAYVANEQGECVYNPVFYEGTS
jgi:hypothetical protein